MAGVIPMQSFVPFANALAGQKAYEAEAARRLRAERQQNEALARQAEQMRLAAEVAREGAWAQASGAKSAAKWGAFGQVATAASNARAAREAAAAQERISTAEIGSRERLGFGEQDTSKTLAEKRAELARTMMAAEQKHEAALAQLPYDKIPAAEAARNTVVENLMKPTAGEADAERQARVGEWVTRILGQAGLASTAAGKQRAIDSLTAQVPEDIREAVAAMVRIPREEIRPGLGEVGGGTRAATRIKNFLRGIGEFGTEMIGYGQDYFKAPPALVEPTPWSPPTPDRPDAYKRYQQYVARRARNAHGTRQ